MLGCQHDEEESDSAAKSSIIKAHIQHHQDHHQDKEGELCKCVSLDRRGHELSPSPANPPTNHMLMMMVVTMMVLVGQPKPPSECQCCKRILSARVIQI